MQQTMWAEQTCMAASQASRGCTRSCRLLYLTPGTRFFPPLQQSSATSNSIAKVQRACSFALLAIKVRAIVDAFLLIICLTQHCQAAV